jgi:hypothetical protein
MIAAVMALIDTCGRRHRRFEELFDPLKCGNGASAAWGTPTIDRLLLLRGEPWMNDEKRLNSAFPGPWLPRNTKGPRQTREPFAHSNTQHRIR